MSITVTLAGRDAPLRANQSKFTRRGSQSFEGSKPLASITVF